MRRDGLADLIGERRVELKVAQSVERNRHDRAFSGHRLLHEASRVGRHHAHAVGARLDVGDVPVEQDLLAPNAVGKRVDQSNVSSAYAMERQAVADDDDVDRGGLGLARDQAR